jgi:hypothetical protein
METLASLVLEDHVLEAIPLDTISLEATRGLQHQTWCLFVARRGRLRGIFFGGIVPKSHTSRNQAGQFFFLSYHASERCGV